MTSTLRSEIMIVEDDQDTRELVHEFLESEGYRVNSFPNGRKAIEALLQGLQPKIILVDWRMPVMNGKEFIEEYRKRESELPQIPIYLFSAESNSRLFTDVDCDGVLSKPINLKSLLSVLPAPELARQH